MKHTLSHPLETTSVQKSDVKKGIISMRPSTTTKLIAAFVVFSAGATANAQSNSFGDQECSLVSTDYQDRDSEIQQFIDDGNASGVRWDNDEAGLVVNYAGGVFSGTPLGIQDNVVCPATGDFDNDGWDDIITGMDKVNEIRFYKNKTYEATDCVNDPANCDNDGVDRYYDLGTDRYVPKLGPATVRRPNFVHTASPQNLADLRNGDNAIFCGANAGDFDNDGNLDFIYFRRGAGGYAPIKEASLWYGNGDGTFQQAPGGLESSLYDGTTWNTLLSGITTSELQRVSHYTDNSFVYDWNRDGWDDILWARAATRTTYPYPEGATGGSVIALLNNCPDIYDSTNPQPCSVQPKFEINYPQSYVIQDVGLDWDSLNWNNKAQYSGVSTIKLADFNDDGYDDMIIGGTRSNKLRMYPGAPGTPAIDVTSPTELLNAGFFTFSMIGDFSLNGHPDFMVGTETYNGQYIGECRMTPDTDADGVPDSLPPTGIECDPYDPSITISGKQQHGGYTYFYENNGTSDPFPNGWKNPPGPLTRYGQECGIGCGLYDWDTGVVLDYDNDPQGTLDTFMADGNNTKTYFVFANRTTQLYAECGFVSSGRLDLDSLEDDQIVINGVRMTPNPAPQIPAGTTVKYEASNDNGITWNEAIDCDGSAPDGPDYCVTFPDRTERDILWRVELCSSDDRTETPIFYGMDLNFDYTEASENYRAGVIVSNGVAYLGGTQQPNNLGVYYALNADLDEQYFELGEELGYMSDAARNIYTVANDKKTLLNFDLGNKDDTDLQAAVGGTEADTVNVISWARSERFGIDAPPLFTLGKLGAIKSATSAILTPPVRPSWYQYATPVQKSTIDTFVDDHTSRPPVSFIGSMDGSIHAVHVQITPGDAIGTEAWSIIPNSIVGNMSHDQTLKWPETYPDASPALADVFFQDGSLHTVLVANMGNGGRSVMAMDVTDTVTSTGNVENPPTPLWELFPGGITKAGHTYSKPVIARVNSPSGVERFISIFSSGKDSLDSSKGRDVVAVDIETGTELWNFQSACTVTTDIVVYETDSLQEPGGYTFDGYIDFAVWADECGNVYKVDANAESGWNTSAPNTLGYGNIDTGKVSDSGHNIKALFSTSQTPNTVLEERPISGTIGARENVDGEIVLFFGTGGLENFDNSKTNEFYAVFSHDGSVRDKLTATCDSSPCEKFYGGVVVTNDQVIYSRAKDPEIATGTCDTGSSVVEAANLENLSTQSFSVNIATGAAVSAMFGDAGAIFLSTLGGDVIRIGQSTAGDAGTGGSIGSGNTTTIQSNTDNPGEALSVWGWREF